MKNLRIIVRYDPAYTVDEIQNDIILITESKIKEKPTTLEFNSDLFYMWENISIDDEYPLITDIRKYLGKKFSVSVKETQITWWDKNGEKAFVFMGGASVVGLAVGIASWIASYLDHI